MKGGALFFPYVLCLYAAIWVMIVTVLAYMISPGLMPLIYLFLRRLATYILRHQDPYYHLINNNMAVDVSR